MIFYDMKWKKNFWFHFFLLFTYFYRSENRVVIVCLKKWYKIYLRTLSLCYWESVLYLLCFNTNLWKNAVDFWGKNVDSRLNLDNSTKSLSKLLSTSSGKKLYIEKTNSNRANTLLLCALIRAADTCDEYT